MKRIIFLLLILMGSVSLAMAYDGCLQHLSPEEFRQKQKTFITEKAGLTNEEAEKFFPIYFELQEKKRRLNDKAWKFLHKEKEGKVSEAEYEEMVLGVYNSRIESNELEKEYYTKFRQILSAQKIYLVQKAETRFHRELVRDASRGKEGPRRK